MEEEHVSLDSGEAVSSNSDNNNPSKDFTDAVEGADNIAQHKGQEITDLVRVAQQEHVFNESVDLKDIETDNNLCDTVKSDSKTFEIAGDQTEITDEKRSDEINKINTGLGISENQTNQTEIIIERVGGNDCDKVEVELENKDSDGKLKVEEKDTETDSGLEDHSCDTIEVPDNEFDESISQTEDNTEGLVNGDRTNKFSDEDGIKLRLDSEDLEQEIDIFEIEMGNKLEVEEKIEHEKEERKGEIYLDNANGNEIQGEKDMNMETKEFVSSHGKTCSENEDDVANGNKDCENTDQVIDNNGKNSTKEEDNKLDNVNVESNGIHIDEQRRDNENVENEIDDSGYKGMDEKEDKETIGLISVDETKVRKYVESVIERAKGIFMQENGQEESNQGNHNKDNMVCTDHVENKVVFDNVEENEVKSRPLDESCDKMDPVSDDKDHDIENEVKTGEQDKYNDRPEEDMVENEELKADGNNGNKDINFSNDSPSASKDLQKSENDLNEVKDVNGNSIESTSGVDDEVTLIKDPQTETIVDDGLTLDSNEIQSGRGEGKINGEINESNGSDLANKEIEESVDNDASKTGESDLNMTANIDEDKMGHNEIVVRSDPKDDAVVSPDVVVKNTADNDVNKQCETGNNIHDKVDNNTEDNARQHDEHVLCMEENCIGDNMKEGEAVSVTPEESVKQEKESSNHPDFELKSEKKEEIIDTKDMVDYKPYDDTNQHLESGNHSNEGFSRVGYEEEAINEDEEAKLLEAAGGTDVVAQGNFEEQDAESLKVDQRVKMLEGKLADARSALQMSQLHQLDERAKHNREVMGLKLQLYQSRLELNRQHSKNEKQLADVMSHLVFLEGKLRKEQIHVKKEIKQREDLIQNQDKEILKLKDQNEQLYNAIKEICEKGGMNGYMRENRKKNGENVENGSKNGKDKKAHNGKLGSMKDKFLAKNRSSLELNSFNLEKYLIKNDRLCSSHEDLHRIGNERRQSIPQNHRYKEPKGSDKSSKENGHEYYSSSPSGRNNKPSQNFFSEHNGSKFQMNKSTSDSSQLSENANSSGIYSLSDHDLSSHDNSISSPFPGEHDYHDDDDDEDDDRIFSFSSTHINTVIDEEEAIGPIVSHSGNMMSMGSMPVLTNLKEDELIAGKNRPHSLSSVDLLSIQKQAKKRQEIVKMEEEHDSSTPPPSPSYNQSKNELTPFQTFKTMFRRKGSKNKGKKRSVSLSQTTNKEYSEALKKHFQKYDMS